MPDCYALLQAVFKNGVQRLLKVRNRKNTLYLYLRRIVEAFQQAIPSELHQMLVGVLASLPIFENATAVSSETP